METDKTHKISIDLRLQSARIDDALESSLHPHLSFCDDKTDIRDEILKLLQQKFENVSLKDYTQWAALNLASTIRQPRTWTNTRKAFR